MRRTGLGRGVINNISNYITFGAIFLIKDGKLAHELTIIAFWDIAPCNLIEVDKVSEKRTAST
jgi:hypothetical protein